MPHQPPPSPLALLPVFAIVAACTSTSLPPLDAAEPPTPSTRPTATLTRTSPSPTQLPHHSATPTVIKPAAEWTADALYASAWLPDSSGVAQSLLRGGDLGISLYDTRWFKESWFVPFGVSMGLAASPDSKLLALPDPTENFVDFFVAQHGGIARPSLESPSCWGAYFGLFDPTGTLFLTGHFPIEPFPRSSVYAWNLVTHSCEPVILDQEGVLQSLDLTNDGSVLATGFSELYSREPSGEPTSQVMLWDFPSMRFRCWLPGLHARFSPTEDVIAVSSDTRRAVAFYDIQHCQFRREIAGPAWPFDLAPTTPILASASASCITFFDAQTGDTLQELPWQHAGRPDTVQFSPDGDHLLVANEGNGRPSSATITLWPVVVSSP